MDYDIISSIDTRLQKGQVNRSPEFCLKLLIYRYLFETGHAPGDLPDGAIFVHRAIVLTNLIMVHWVLLHKTYPDPVVSDRRVFFMFSLCKSI